MWSCVPTLQGDGAWAPPAPSPARVVPETVDGREGSGATRVGSSRRCPRQRLSRLAMGLMACSLLATFPTFATIPGTLPPVQTHGVVSSVRGGIGPQEAQAFAAAARPYPLDLACAITHTPCAQSAADVHVMMTDAQGKRVLVSWCWSCATEPPGQGRPPYTAPRANPSTGGWEQRGWALQSRWSHREVCESVAQPLGAVVSLGEATPHRRARMVD